MEWTRYNKHNPCPVCFGRQFPREDCRSHNVDGTELYFCRSVDPDPDFVFRKYDPNGFGIFVTGTADKEQREQWLKRQQERKDREAKERESRLSNADLNFHFKRLQSFLDLNQKHHGNLIGRGLTPEQISELGFRSIFKGQKVPGTPWNLPGFRRGIFQNQSGMLCPARDADGLILGYQIRLDNPPNPKNKYNWLKGNKSSHLQNGECPLNVAKPQNPYSDYIALSEGILKSSIASTRHNRVFIGTGFSGNFASTKENFKASLDKVSNKLGTKLVVLFPDAGSKMNPHVMRSYSETYNLVRELGYEFKVATWKGQEIKKKEGGKDCDEIPTGTEIKLVSWDEFCKGAIKSEFEIKQQEKQLETRQDKAYRLWKTSRELTPNHQINERYFPEHLIHWQTYQAIKSGLGTGKSEAIARALSRLEGGAVALGSRNSLLLQLCERWGFYHINYHDPKTLLKDPNLRIAFCVDSIIHFDKSFFENKVIIIDELESIINHLLLGSTCKKYRQQIKTLFREALEVAKSVIVLDGNLTDNTIDYLCDLMGIGRDKWEVFVNTYKPSKPLVEFHLGFVKDGKLRQKNKALHHSILNAKKPIILSDAQIECEAVEEALSRENRKGLRLDSKTVSDPILGKVCKTFLQNPDKWIEENNPDYIIISPTGGEGLDISIKDYFSDCYLISYGVLGVDSLLQMLGRCRHPKAIHVYVKESVKGDTEFNRSPFPDEIKATLTGNLTSEAVELLGGIEGIEQLLKASQDKHFEHECKLNAKGNYERANLRKCFLEALKLSGYEVQITVIETDGTTSEALSEVGFGGYEVKRGRGLDSDVITNLKDEIKLANSLQIAESPNLTDDDAQELEAKFCLSWPEQASVIKYHLARQLPGVDLDRDLVYEVRYRDRGLIQAFNTGWQLLNQDDAKFLATESWKKRLDGGALNLSDTKARWLKFSKLSKIGADGLLQIIGQEFSEQSDIVQQIYQKSKVRGVYDALGTSPGKLTPMQWVGKLCRMMGLTLKQKSRKGSDGNREQHYQLVYGSVFYHQIWEAISRKNRFEVERLKNQSEQGLEARQSPPKNYINLEGEIDAKIEPEGMQNGTSIQSGLEVSTPLPDPQDVLDYIEMFSPVDDSDDGYEIYKALVNTPAPKEPEQLRLQESIKKAALQKMDLKQRALLKRFYQKFLVELTSEAIQDPAQLPKIYQPRLLDEVFLRLPVNQRVTLATLQQRA